MTVSDLVAKLLECDPDAQVVGYDSHSKDDFLINSVKNASVIKEETWGDKSFSGFYTKGISIAEAEPLGKNFVVIS